MHCGEWILRGQAWIQAGLLGGVDNRKEMGDMDYSKGGKWIAWEYILGTELTDNLDMLERERHRVSLLGFWPEQWRWRRLGKSRFYMKFCFGHVKFDMPVRHLSQYTFMCKAHGMQGELHT